MPSALALSTVVAEQPSLESTLLLLGAALAMGLWGRCLLATLPPGSPGGASTSELAATVGASLLLAWVVELAGAALLPAEIPLTAQWAIFGLGLAPPVILALRWLLGPAAMRPRRPLRSQPVDDRSRRRLDTALALLILLALAARLVFSNEGSLAPAQWPSVLNGDEQVLTHQLLATGTASLLGLARAWPTTVRRGSILGVLLTLALLPPAIEAWAVALGSAAVMLSVYRQRGERRCLVLAPFYLQLPLGAGTDGDPRLVAAALVAAWLSVPRSAWSRARAPFALAGLTLLLCW